MSNDFRGEHTLRIGGAEYPVLINYNSLRIMCREEKMEFSDLDAAMTDRALDTVPMIVYYGMRNYCIKMSKKVPFEDYEVFCANALDEPGGFEAMLEMVTGSMSVQKPATKKKATTRTRK
tara:strand:+ start:180 stop:539 length:360 start_codon:yes stop_codon:yes gene_type:complete